MYFDFIGRQNRKPFRKIRHVDVVQSSPKALTKNEWNAVRRQAENLIPKDQGLALAVVCMMRHAGPRVGEIAALKLSDVELSSRQGCLIIRRGKGLKHREIPLVVEAREPIQKYLLHRRRLANKWKQRARFRGQESPKWAEWPDVYFWSNGDR